MVSRWFIVVVTLGLLAAPPSAAAVRLRARLPAVVTTSAVVRVPGRAVRGARVRLQQVIRGRWRSLPAGSRFPLRWRAPRRAGVVRLRVVAIRRGRVVASTAPRRVAVSATRVLSAARLVAAPPPGGSGVLRYEGEVAVRPGQFVAAGTGPATPYGLLARVVAVRHERHGVALSVEPARLTDAVPAGHVSIRPGSLAAAAAPTGRHFAAGFACSSGIASVDGSLALRLTPTFALDWSLDGIDSVEAAATLRGDADLEATAGAGASCILDQTVARWDAPPLRFALGPIPVVIVPRTELNLAGKASADGGIATGIHGRIAATAGIRWDGSAHPIGRFRPGFSYSPPAARVSGTIAARVIPSITFLLYGQSGPRFGLSTGLQLDADAAADPWWTLGAPVELFAALELPGVADLWIPPLTVFSRTFPIAHADPAAQSPSAGPQPAPGPAAERARISWDTAATDVDLHVWDAAGHHAWFRDPSGIPGGELSEDDRFGFGPEYFTDHAGGRPLTFGLCYFDDGGAGATHVSVRLTDPDGSVRDSSRTLAREGDHVLIGSSPAGGGYVPPEGWCRP
jgi:hypothetical protein